MISADPGPGDHDRAPLALERRTAALRDALGDRYDVAALVNLVRVGCGALSAEVVPSTAAVEQVRRARVLRTGYRFLRDLGA